MTTQRNKALLALLPYTIILIFGFSTWTWANTWRDTYTLAEYHAIHHPESPRANNFAASVAVLEKNDFIRAIQYTLNGIRVDPEEVGFRLDMRLLLAKLESEINSGLDKARIKTHGKHFHIDALPNAIQVTNVNGIVKLAHSSSNGSAISEILRDKPISVYGVVALEALTKCVTKNAGVCEPLVQEATDWLDTAAKSSKSTTEYRALIASNAAKLHANAGDFRRALDYITQANRLVPGSTYYELGKAEYLIKLGKTDEADVLLSRIEKLDVAVRANQETIEFLRKIQSDIAVNKH